MPSTSDIATPPEAPSFLSKPEVLEFGARAFAWFSNWWEKPVRVGTKVFVGRHIDAVEVLSRDLDFLIGPVNATKIDEVNGPFSDLLVQAHGGLAIPRGGYSNIVAIG